METKRLAIGGKVVSIENIGNKSLAQFKSQLKLAKVNVSEEIVEKVYNRFNGGSNK